ncbi:dehydrodolichyl diphosphate synthase complex subunit DHDDS-like isoform X1 [Haemaphysalis longicornis]
MAANVTAEGAADDECGGALAEVRVPWHERLLAWLLSLGPVPRSIGLIPDGNRRFARRRGLSVDHGHIAGSKTLGRIGAWSDLVGVKESVIYVFSSDNFKRPQSEKNGIFAEIARRCQYVLVNADRFRERGRRIRCVGELELLPGNLQRLLATVELVTAGNSGSTMVACVAYSSRRQVTGMVQQFARAVSEGRLRSEDITADLIDECMSLGDGTGVDLLLRTSGETRLSDFLLWQSGHACLHFEPKTMPEIGFGDYLCALIGFQVQCKSLRVAKRRSSDKCSPVGLSSEQSLRQQSFIKRLGAERISYLERLAQHDG